MRRVSVILAASAVILSATLAAPARAGDHDWHHGWYGHRWHHHHHGYAWGHYKPRYWYPGYYGYYGYYPPPPPPPAYYPPSITFGFDFH